MRQTALRATITALVTAILVALLPGAAQASPWVFVFIVDRPAETCLAGDSLVPSVQPCVDSNYHMWTFEDVTPGRYRIRNTATGQCLATTGFSVVQQQACGTGTEQQWTLNGRGNTFTISNAGAGRCIYRQGGSAVGLGTCVPLVARWHLLF